VRQFAAGGRNFWSMSDTIDDKGYMSAPQKPGLGYDIDSDKVEDLTLQRF
jgi:L-alanine-DL-glutamate epimerase-like enolase superfamily enzyme